MGPFVEPPAYCCCVALVADNVMPLRLFFHSGSFSFFHDFLVSARKVGLRDAKPSLFIVQRGTDQQKDKALETFDTIKGAIIGVAAKTFQDFLGQIIPGFKEQFQKTAQEKHAAVSSADRKLAGPATSTQ
jgi:hypothetical protein